jgi:hypothetical protein
MRRINISIILINASDNKTKVKTNNRNINPKKKNNRKTMNNLENEKKTLRNLF